MRKTAPVVTRRRAGNDDSANIRVSGNSSGSTKAYDEFCSMIVMEHFFDEYGVAHATEIMKMDDPDTLFLFRLGNRDSGPAPAPGGPQLTRVGERGIMTRCIKMRIEQ